MRHDTSARADFAKDDLPPELPGPAFINGLEVLTATELAECDGAHLTHLLARVAAGTEACRYVYGNGRKVRCARTTRS